MNACIIASTANHLPEKDVRNEDLVQFPRGAQKLIGQKTGVLRRRHALEEECTSDLAIHAARKCLEKIDFPADQVECIVLSTSSPDQLQPATATRVQHALEANKACAFDINSVCSGSVYGIGLADAFIRSGSYQNLLLVASEVYSKYLNPGDFSTYPYFGDGAGAVLFQRSESGGGVTRSILRTDGSGADVIGIPGGGTRVPFGKITDSKQCYFQMEGRKVYEFAVTKGPEVIQEVVEASNLSVQDIACFISHQANVNVLNEIAQKIGVHSDKFFVNLDKYGNTASASALIALDEAISSRCVGSGDLVVTVAFGGGLSWGANLIQL